MTPKLTMILQTQLKTRLILANDAITSQSSTSEINGFLEAFRTTVADHDFPNGTLTTTPDLNTVGVIEDDVRL